MITTTRERRLLVRPSIRMRGRVFAARAISSNDSVNPSMPRERELAKFFVDCLSLVTASNHCCVEVPWSLFVVYALDVERDSDLGTVVAEQLRKV